jgi:hypothetical protein
MMYLYVIVFMDACNKLPMGAQHREYRSRVLPQMRQQGRSG